MGYFQVRYNSIVVNYDRRGFIRLATGSSPKHTINAFIIYSQICAIFVLWKERKQTKRGRVRPIFKKNADAKKAKYVVEGSNCLISYKCSNLGICLFLLFSHSNSNLNYINWKRQMLRLGFEPRAADWKSLTIPLSYAGRPNGLQVVCTI